MASGNQIALAQGRITQDQYDSMAAHKLICHNNWDDLDPNCDYSRYYVTKWYPVITFATRDDRPIVSPRGFVKYMMDQIGCTDYDIDDIVDQCYDGDPYVTFTYRNMGFTWCYDRDYHRNKMDAVIYYTFGACFGGDSDPLSQYVSDVVEDYT